MAKRSNETGDFAIVRPRRKLIYTGHPFSFLESPYLLELYDQLHTNVLYAWLHGDLGDFDNPTITRDYVFNMWRDMSVHAFFTSAYVMEHYVEKEIIFWKNMFPNGNVEVIWRDMITV